MAIVSVDNSRKNIILYIAFVIFFATCLRITSTRDNITASLKCSTFYATDSPECRSDADSGTLPPPGELPGDGSSPYINNLVGVESTTVPPQEVYHEKPQAGEKLSAQSGLEPSKSGYLKPDPGSSIKSLTSYRKRTSNKVAAIIETRMQIGMFAILLHFSGILGPEWPIVLFTTPEAYKDYAHSNSSAINRLIKNGGLEIKLLPNGVDFPNTTMYSKYMCEKHMWEELAPAEHILIFQSDSMLCANSPLSVDDFLEYDIIGAPITAKHGRGFNGGFSLRKRSSTLRVLERFDWNNYPKPALEDQWYHGRLLELQAEDMNLTSTSNIHIPDVNTGKMFAVETQDYPTPVGVHQARRFPKEETIPLELYCPEFRLSTGPWHI
ncbi:hypothetical protein BP5796_00711 [Coleophoma crateriformis]|uniref:DUF5672 domain-containing protein n=1 Tax=Coleophoma crateriformis TaxID=565419 RepID=A0A3D8TAK0_9HELO|nr:hypothetical protein BP5796_00711 [Coleophoma crateriformis]